MEIVRINPKSFNYKGIFDAASCNLLDSEAAYVFGGYENKELKALAVFQDYPNVDTYVILKYIYVPKNLRGNGYAMAMLEGCEALLKSIGYTKVAVKLLGDSEDIRKPSDFLIKMKYVPSLADGHFVSYYLGDLKETIFAGMINQMRALLQNVKFDKEIDSLMLKHFIAETRSKGLEYDFSSPDLLFTSYYVIDGQIKGYMNFKEVEENVLLLSESYIDEGARSKYIMPAMLANSLKIAFAVMPDETMIFMQLNKENQYAGVKSIYGEAEHDDLVFEFYKVL